MILIDWSYCCISNLMAEMMHRSPGIKGDQDYTVNIDILRHIVLNSLRSYRMKFKNEYGELVICVDDKEYWRKEIFPQYKAHRAKNRKESPLDWKEIFRRINELKEEMIAFFPYKVIQVSKAEGDDIIGVLAELQEEKTLIVGKDGDFFQCHKYQTVSQYNTTTKKMVNVMNPVYTLREKILRGERGDGIPNFLSPDNSFTDEIRQKTIKKTDLARWIKAKNPEDFCDATMLKGFKRNQKLIDFDYIPQEIKDAIINEWKKPNKNSRKLIFNYMLEKGLDKLLDNISQF